MEEEARTIDYSMPWAHGLYPPPPYHYKKMRSMVSLFQVEDEVKRKFLPPEFEPMKMFDSILKM